MRIEKAWLTGALLSIGLMSISMAVQAAVSTEIWRDDFNRTASDTVGEGWVEGETAVSNASIGTSEGRSALQLHGDGTYVQRMIPTNGYSNLYVVWQVKGSPGQLTRDRLRMYITKDGGATWYPRLGEAIIIFNNAWPDYDTSAIIDPEYQVAGFGIRLELDLDTSLSTGNPNPDGRDAFVDYIYVTGIPSADATPPEVTNVTANDVVFPADATVTATATDAASTIKSAEYSRDGTPWAAMSAADGAFDGQSEGLTATISGLYVKTYEVCVRATDVNDNTSDGTACDTFDVTAAQLSVAFAGPELDLDGAPTELKAAVTGPCSSGAEVEFFADLGSGYVSQGTATTDLSGVATRSVTLPAGGIYDIKVVVGDQDLGGDELAECQGDADTTGITVVADPKASSTGGGWYKVDDLSPPRINFGYTAQTKYNKKLDEYSTSGNLLWMHQDNYRLKGVINAGGKLPDQACPNEFAACAAFAGEGTLYQHNPAYDPECVELYGCEQEWINAIPNNAFIFFVNDGGIVEECLNKKKCREVELPDQFGIEIAIENVSGETDPVDLSGGNLIVR